MTRPCLLPACLMLLLGVAVLAQAGPGDFNQLPAASGGVGGASFVLDRNVGLEAFGLYLRPGGEGWAAPGDRLGDRRQFLEEWRSLRRGQLPNILPPRYEYYFGPPTTRPATPPGTFPRFRFAPPRGNPFVIDPIPGWSPPPGAVPRYFNGVRYWVIPLKDG
ncbi:MAG: hypothetical protein RMJ35_00730 [Phycisphaerales bacterium]|nr:hypothetical protein [Phycisphaerales bacterium]